MGRLYRGLVRPLLFRLPPEPAHAVGVAAARAAGALGSALRPFLRVSDPRLEVTLGGGARTLRFPNPIGLGAGMDKDGRAPRGWEALGFGFIELGTVTPRPQAGNPRPRLFRRPAERSLVNRLGFNNAGVEALARRLAGSPRPSVPLGINIGRNRDTPNDRAVGDYIRGLRVLFDFGDYFVFNVSSPNTPGLRDLQSPGRLGPLLRALRDESDRLASQSPRGKRPFLFVKVSPDEPDVEALAASVASSGLDGLVATNTSADRSLLADAGEGGRSGAVLRDRADRVLSEMAPAAARHGLILIGAGGIFTAEDAARKLRLGASLVQVYTGFVYEGPGLPRVLNRGLLRVLEREGLSSIADLSRQRAAAS